MSVLFTPGVNGSPADVTQYNANWDLLERSFADRGPYLISGLAVTSGAGLAVNVAAGVASIGGRVTVAGSFAIAGLAPSATNHLYLLQNGTGTANTTGTQPALSAKLGTCTTGVSSVSSVSQARSSGCQQQVRTESLVPGGPGAGNPASISLAGWAAAAADGVTVFGTLPGGALGSPTLAGDLTLSGHNLVTDTVTGTAIGTGATQKLGFYGAVPVAQIAGSTDVLAGLVTQGLRAASSNPPLNLGSGALTAGASALGATTVGGHLLSTGTIPTVAAGAAAGGSPPAPVIVAGSTDFRGTVTFGSGTAPGAGAMVRLTFAAAFVGTPFVFLQSRDDTVTTEVMSVANENIGHFDIWFHNAPAASQANTRWVVHYLCIG